MKLRLAIFAAALCTLTSLPALAQSPVTDRPIRVVIVGLVHGHVKGFLNALPKNPAAQLVGIVEPNTALAHQYATQYHLPAALFSTDLERTLTTQHPDAVLVYTTIQDHRRVIEAAARHNISSMVEKPLTTTMEDALAIRRAAREHHVHVLVNYETTWYTSNAEAIREAQADHLGTIRRVVVHDGHEGPKEIGVGPEWLPWLTDPVQNGAGALFDFGCYGADLMTVLMHGKAPLSVTAVTQTDKPQIYPHVDDEATIIIRYPGAQAVLMPSWNWPFARKDMEVYGATGYLITVGPNGLRSRYHGEKEESQKNAPPLASEQSNSLAYLAAVLHGKINPQGDLSSLDTNMIVMQILDAARTSAQTGRTVELKPLPQ
ncbi:Gfo/Idh/MocA family protein [Edaphobacter albus]|uniref:Gfo/Idh/MocA family protein n=1 Tax=Edaphobacter sp. 4G125 TaxID=2763071 RepID=UPI001646DA2F|nr:Gfo/Idh/MocA family oxidoreductase [Edaphobacter sp. 4G125]QNI38310.1 Gfo/Idh/MocA family oxidoreductase [Edaphobacter sp. 4G125]